MIEILWHGRGGQGAFTAARLLGAACSMAPGRHALAFPSFGPERRGAPMRAFTKLDDRPIGDRSASTRADFVVYLDETLLAPGWEDELKPGGRVLVNSTAAFADPRVTAIDADGISTEVLGRAIPNTVFLGALAALCDEVRAKDVCEAIRQYMPEKLHAKNLAVVERVLAEKDVWGAGRAEAASGSACAGKHACADDTAGAAGANIQAAGEDTPAHECDHALADDAPGAAGANVQVAGLERPASGAAPQAFTDAPRNLAPAAPSPALLGCNGAPRVIPTLRAAHLDPAVFARTTCFEAGHLVSKNAGWRSVRPVLDEAACTRGLLCYMQCPDGTIYKVADEAGRGGIRLGVDYDFCKGCGVCAKACRCGAISMVPEHEEAR